jgi:bud emergence protein 1
MLSTTDVRYVAKHISRVGGPGLIPVSFVEICDPLTRQPIDLAPDEIPKVEEWKKITAEYKAAAIPLGRFDEPNAGSSAPYGNSPYAPSVSDANSQTGLLRSGSSNSVPFYRPEVDLMLPPGELTALSVPSFHNESGNYWFRLHVTHVPDEPSAPAYSLSLYRTYEDFYDFQISLLDTFPYEAGRPRSGEEDTEPPERILPYMPGPVEDAIDEDLTEYRREELDLYVKALVNLRTKDAGYIVRHELFRTFFAAKYGDYCEETLRQTAMEDLEERLQEVHVQDRAISSASQRSQSLSADPRSSLPTRSSSRASPMAQESASSRPPSSQQHYFSGGPSTGTSFGAPSPVNRHQHSASQSQTQGQPPYVKIKIYDRATDDLIALRVHPHVSHAELFEKVRARLGSEVSVLRYRTSMTQAGYKDIRDDAELRDWMRTEDQKLVLYAEQ